MKKLKAWAVVWKGKRSEILNERDQLLIFDNEVVAERAVFHNDYKELIEVEITLKMPFG